MAVAELSVLRPGAQRDGMVAGTQKRALERGSPWENLGPLIKGCSWLEGNATEGEPGNDSDFLLLFPSNPLPRLSIDPMQFKAIGVLLKVAFWDREQHQERWGIDLERQMEAI